MHVHKYFIYEDICFSIVSNTKKLITLKCISIDNATTDEMSMLELHYKALKKIVVGKWLVLLGKVQIILLQYQIPNNISKNTFFFFKQKACCIGTDL